MPGFSYVLTRHLIGDCISTAPSLSSKRSCWTVRNSEACKSGETFPEYPIVRLRIAFVSTSRELKSTCAKNYKLSESYTPGIFTIQCVCFRRITLGVSVLLAQESTITAMNAISTRFASLFRRVFYENGCNPLLSAIIRVPTLLKHTQVLVDHFHYETHTCSNMFDPDIWAERDVMSTSGAEALNRA